ncbi:phosphate transport system permease protein [Candidatus Thermokryptus mobilis]|uniref:Phosphate transport system permease protein PstA n=1 Tax=Candidatus Thermokryptus mobilis TaxID=1643428 RepID=A0A0S4NDP1_9BACT|nr:phosphate ABC transporter permease PstA [Candidatus Thermokryptus mobilis]CUU08294.1 phosphate transport system permease protein [Candidatus Thermokryptus mobilis]
MSSYRFRIFKSKIISIILTLVALASTVPFLLVIYFIVKNGISVINWEFITHLPKPVGEPGGGILNALVGTVILILIALTLSVPFGISVGIYLAEKSESRVSFFARLITEILQGVPSIVVGIIAYLWVVKPMGHFSALSGGIALGIMMLPVIIKSTEEILKLIPREIKEASLALGVPYYKTILKVLLPAGLSGILSGILAGTARIAGETAPLLFTAFGNPFLNFNILKPVSAMPLLIFNYAISPYEDWWTKAWGASCILVLFVLTLNVITRLISSRR